MITTEQFLAWFSGLSRKIKGRPSKQDWEEVLANLKELEAKSTVKAWFQGRLSEVKGVPSEKLWREIKDYVTAAYEKTRKVNRIHDPFESFGNKDAPGQKPSARSSPFGRKK